MINQRLSLGWYVSADGACWTHLLLWIAKDLAWLQCWLWASTGFAIVGCSLSLFMIFRNIRTGEWLCAVSEVGVLVWLYGNAEWMYGECHDFTYKVTDPDLALDDHTTAESALVLWAAGAIFAALCIIRFFRGRWCFRRQHTLWLVSGDDNDIDELQPHGWMRCVFREWSDYEEFHNLTWLCCDLSWNLLNAGFWWPAAALTLCIACDTTAVSSRSRDGSVDTAHYFFQMLWVLSNSLWVYGDLYTNQDNQDPEIIISILAPTRDALSNFRFLSSVACLLALLMGVIFHLYWAWISLARSIFVPTRIQFLLSLEDDGMSLQTYRRFDDDRSFPVTHYDRLSPPTVDRRDGVECSLNALEDSGGSALDPSHSPPRYAVGDDMQLLLGVGKKGARSAFVTPPPARHSATAETVLWRAEDVSIN